MEAMVALDELLVLASWHLHGLVASASIPALDATWPWCESVPGLRLLDSAEAQWKEQHVRSQSLTRTGCTAARLAPQCFAGPCIAGQPR